LCYNETMNGYDSTYATSSSVSPALFAVIMLLYFIIIVGIYVVSSILLGRIFKKAGVPAWIAWVPFYNNWKLLELGDQAGFWSVLSVLPIVNLVSIVFMYIAMYHIGLKLGKSGAFVLWAIFLPIVWLIWLAVDHSKWGDTYQPVVRQA